MLVIHERNVNHAYVKGHQILADHGVTAPSRYGEVVEMPVPVTTQYLKPDERVLFDPVRDANPFFHLFESLWMLDGRNDVAWLSRFAARIAEFSDDGTTFHGAYGFRWRAHFGRDQLLDLVAELTESPGSRRAVLQIWDAVRDLHHPGKDFPCNVGAVFSLRHQGQLNLTVFNRSNDMVWGAYGANVVQFSMLQEVIAGLVGAPLGQYWQVSNNFHAYTGVWDRDQVPSLLDPYTLGRVKPLPLFTPGVDPALWWEDLHRWMDWTSAAPKDTPPWNHTWFRDVAVPMYWAWHTWKQLGDKTYALEIAQQIKATDWSMAVTKWLGRRRG